jgi:hypothetical protein
MVVASFVLIFGAIATLAISRLGAEDDPVPAELREEVGLPAPLELATPIPEADSSGSASIEDASARLDSVAGVGDVLAAASRGDARSIVEFFAAESVSCSEARTGGVGCSDGETLAVVRWAGVHERLQRLDDTEDWIEALLAAGATADLIVRDARTPDGAGGIFYLGFGTPSPAEVRPGGLETGGFGLIVHSGADKPIVAVSYLSPFSGSTVWVEAMLPEHRALLAPMSLEGRPSLNDDVRLPRGYPGFPDGYPHHEE